MMCVFSARKMGFIATGSTSSAVQHAWTSDGGPPCSASGPMVLKWVDLGKCCYKTGEMLALNSAGLNMIHYWMLFSTGKLEMVSSFNMINYWCWNLISSLLGYKIPILLCTHDTHCILCTVILLAREILMISKHAKTPLLLLQTNECLEHSIAEWNKCFPRSLL